MTHADIQQLYREARRTLQHRLDQSNADRVWDGSVVAQGWGEGSGWDVDPVVDTSAPDMDSGSESSSVSE